MKLPWRYIIISLLIGGFIGSALSLWCIRSHYGPGKRWSTERMLKKFDRQLNLTEDQKTKIHTILQAQREKMRGFRQDIRKSTRGELFKILSPEQQVKYDAMEARRHDNK